MVLEVRNAAQAVETARLRVLAATSGRENAEIQLEGERKLFEAGKSTTFLLFQRENALTNARNAEIRAETDYNKAITDFQRATSTTFLMNNIDVESPTSRSNADLQFTVTISAFNLRCWRADTLSFREVCDNFRREDHRRDHRL